jgi:hypothetical protein
LQGFVLFLCKKQGEKLKEREKQVYPVVKLHISRLSLHDLKVSILCFRVSLTATGRISMANV